MSAPSTTPVRADHHIAEVAGIPSHWWEYAPGSEAAPAGRLVLVHGFRGTHEGLAQIAGVLPALLPGWSICVPDLPGFGRSPAPEEGCTAEAYASWLPGFCEALPSTPGAPLVLLGHSFGSIVVALALAAGLRCAATILVNPISQAALEGPNRVGTRAALGLYRTAAALPERLGRRMLSAPVVVRGMSEIMAKTHDRELRGWIHGQHARYFSVFSSVGDLEQAFRTSCEHTVAEAADELRMPVLLLCGDRDDIVPLAAQQALAASLPDAKLVVFPGVGHLIHYEAPEAAAGEIATFLGDRLGARIHSERGSAA